MLLIEDDFLSGTEEDGKVEKRLLLATLVSCTRKRDEARGRW